MKPSGTIPPGFGAIGEELAIGGRPASALAEQAGGTPLFVYSRERLTTRVAELRAAMPERLAIHYAVKANPYPPLLELMAGLVDGFDIASGGELDIAARAAIEPGKVSFAGPGKDDGELAAAIGAGVTINLESGGEAHRVVRIAERLGRTPHCAIRVNPDFELRGSGMKMGGGAKPFGVDEACVPALAREVIDAGAHWHGLHVYPGSQTLDARAVIEAQASTIDLAERLSRAIDAPLPRLNMGGGFGIPYFAQDKPLDIAAVGAALIERFENLPDVLQGTRFAIELGRWLVGEAGVYLTRIIERKQSHGRTFLITDGGLHHVLAASGNLGTVVRRNYPIAIATRFDVEPQEEVSVVGRLCTPLDRLADEVLLPRAGPDDIVALFSTGAYGASASPAGFLSHGPAAELLV